MLSTLSLTLMPFKMSYKDTKSQSALILVLAIQGNTTRLQPATVND